MAIDDNYIVAIELGSSNVTAIAGRKQPDGTILVSAFEQEKSESFIRKGRINNFTKMTSCLEGMKKKLEDRLHKTITGAYVGIGGMGMHTVSNTVTRHLNEKTLITADHINNVKDSNLSAPGGDREILQAIPQDYKLGTQLVSDPEGIAADVIEGHFLNIVANASLRGEVERCFGEAHIRVMGMPISVMALADAVLNDSEKRSGCVFVDMGAETTSVAIYKNNLLRHLAVIPLGSASINRDICGTLQIEDAEAEKLKLQYGTAAQEDDEADRAPIALNDGRTVKYEDFSALVQARMEEIIMNINNQIKLSQYSLTQLISGLVITGGGANMKGIDKAFSQLTSIERLRVVKAMHLQYKTDAKMPGAFNTDGSCNTAIAIIDKGTENCCVDEVKAEEQLSLFDAETPAETTAATTPAVEEEVEVVVPEEKPEPKKPKAPSRWKRFVSKVSGFATSIVSEEESGDRFPGIRNDKD